jgi:hypothetical protein
MLPTKCRFIILIEGLPYLPPTKLWFIWPSGFRREYFFKSTNQQQELPVAAMFKRSSLKPLRQMSQKFVGGSYGSYKECTFHPDP